MKDGFGCCIPAGVGLIPGEFLKVELGLLTGVIRRWAARYGAGLCYSIPQFYPAALPGVAAVLRGTAGRRRRCLMFDWGG